LFNVSSGLEIFENLAELNAANIHFFEDKRDPGYSDTFLSLSDFPKIQTLFLDSCMFSRFPLIFTHLHSLTLMCCRGFTVLPGFPSLNSLEINTCSKLTELHLCGSGEKKLSICGVNISFCYVLKNLRISRKVSQLSISNCPKLFQLTIESQINFRRVKECPRLTAVQTGNYEVK
jgi:hypothetical protein